MFLLTIFDAPSFLPKSKPITLSIINGLPDQYCFIDDFNIVSKLLAPQGDETYCFENFNINLFFESYYVIKNIHKYERDSAKPKATKLLL